MDEHHEPPHTTEELEQALHEHDDWFRHTPDEPHHQEAHGDFNPYLIMAFLAVTALGVFGTAAVTVGWFAREINDKVVSTDRERESAYTAEYTATRAQWDRDLTGSPEWINEQENTIRIPIELAMEKVVEQYAAEGR
jgi:hypothetical protein